MEEILSIDIRKAPFPEPEYWAISGFHHKLVNYACRMLKEEFDFRDDEIYYEYYVKIPIVADLYHWYLVDVATVHGNRKCIAIECGQTSNLKLRDLKTVFQKVIHLEGGIDKLDPDYSKVLYEKVCEERMGKWGIH